VRSEEEEVEYKVNSKEHNSYKEREYIKDTKQRNTSEKIVRSVSF
jgi:hypothetical protein